MSPAEKMVDDVCKPIEDAGLNRKDGELYATHEGVLEIMGKKLRCYVLNDGRRIFDADDVANFLLPIEEPNY